MKAIANKAPMQDMSPKLDKNRETHGTSHHLMKQLSCLDVSGNRNFVRMDSNSFEILLNMVELKIKRQDSVMREAISPGERLAITLYY